MVVYPNQKVITVLKDECKEDFLQVNNTNWQVACANLTYSAFKLYLYMAGNKNGYSFALSYETINGLIPMNRKTYDNAIRELKDCGYLRQVKGSVWNFSDKI
jgi:hypothetical protein